MRKWLWALLTAGALASGVAVAACGDDDNGEAPPSSTTDGGKDGTITPPGTDSSGDAPGPDAGCTFAGYVMRLINTSTTPQAKPALDLGENCTPTTSQADFASLFP